MGRTSILVVDDSATVRLVLRDALTEQDFDVVMASDGQEALDWVFSNPPADIVITDLHMPNVDGIDLVARLRALDVYADRPIFVLTRGGAGNEKERVRAAGATAWIMKPFDKDKLVSAIHKVVAQPALGRNDRRVARLEPIGVARTVRPKRRASARTTFI
jgi:two-component system chemotaxis response regulator CheY